MAIILDPRIRSFNEYCKIKKWLQRKSEQGQENSALRDRKHRLLVPKKPTECPECKAKHSFWVKGYYFRWVVEGELAEVLPIPRYICSSCSQIVSVLFAFLVPYRHFTAHMISQAIQDYISTRTSYRKVAGEIANDDDVTQRPNHSQVWQWVNLFAKGALQKFEGIMQRACMNAEKESQLTGVRQLSCPNCIRAQSLKKIEKLDSACRMLALASILLGPHVHLVTVLQSYFVVFVQPPSSILTGRGITLFTPQSLKHMIW